MGSFEIGINTAISIMASAKMGFPLAIPFIDVYKRQAPTTVIAKTNIPIGANMTWTVQVPTNVAVTSPCVLLVIFAGRSV